MTDQPTSARSRRGSVVPGRSSRRPSNSTPRVPRKAQEAVDKLLDKIRAKADKGPSSASPETKREEKRDADGHFAKGTKPGPGRPSGSPNKIPKSIKQVVRDLCEGVIEVTFKILRLTSSWKGLSLTSSLNGWWPGSKGEARWTGVQTTRGSPR